MFLEKCSLQAEVSGARVPRYLWAGDTHHVLIVIPLLSWNPSVRVTVSDSKLHGAAKGAGNWRRKQAGQCQWAAQAQSSLVAEGAPSARGTVLYHRVKHTPLFPGQQFSKAACMLVRRQTHKCSFTIHSPLWARIVQKRRHWQTLLLYWYKESSRGATWGAFCHACQRGLHVGNVRTTTLAADKAKKIWIVKEH